MPKWWKKRDREEAIGVWKEPFEPDEEVLLEEDEIKTVFERLWKLRSEHREIPSRFLEPLEEMDEEDDDPAFDSNDPSALPGPGCFDPNRYFEVFDRLRLEPDHRLDYVYECLGNSGRPLLYMRKGSGRIEGLDESASLFPGSECTPNLDGLSFEKSALGFFQFALFCIEAPKFYLYWHANYYDLELVCTRRRLLEILHEIAKEYAIEESDQKKLSETDHRPRIRLKGDSAEVVALSFTKWGGFSTHTSCVTWPNRLHKVHTESLVEYDCGIMY